MFWSTDFNPSPSSIDLVLRRRRIKLSDVLYNDDLLQELKVSNSGLIDFLSKKNVICELLNNITQLTEKDCCVKLSYSKVHAAYISCEILASGSRPITHALLSHSEALSKIISCLITEPKQSSDNEIDNVEIINYDEEDENNGENYGENNETVSDAPKVVITEGSESSENGEKVDIKDKCKENGLEPTAPDENHVVSELVDKDHTEPVHDTSDGKPSLDTIIPSPPSSPPASKVIEPEQTKEAQNVDISHEQDNGKVCDVQKIKENGIETSDSNGQNNNELEVVNNEKEQSGQSQVEDDCDANSAASSPSSESSSTQKQTTFIRIVPQKAALVSRLISTLHSLAASNLSCHVSQDIETFSKLIDVLIHNIDISGCFEILSTFVSSTTPPEMRFVFCEILSKLNFVHSLIDVMTLSEVEDKQRNACQLLCDIIVTSRQEAFEAYQDVGLVPESQAFDMLTLMLESRESIHRILSQMFLSNGINLTAIVCGIKVMQTLVEQKCSNRANITNNVQVSFRARVLEQIQEDIVEYLIKFHELLSNPPKQEPIKTTFGIIQKPLGYVRLEVVNLIRALIGTNSPKIISKLVELRTMPVIIDLFIDYSWNNLLHTQVEQALCLIIKNCRLDEESSYQIDMQNHSHSNIYALEVMRECLIENLSPANGNGLEQKCSNIRDDEDQNNEQEDQEKQKDGLEEKQQQQHQHQLNGTDGAQHEVKIEKADISSPKTESESSIGGSNNKIANVEVYTMRDRVDREIKENELPSILGEQFDSSPIRLNDRPQTNNNDNIAQQQQQHATTSGNSRALLADLLNEYNLIEKLLKQPELCEQANFGHIIQIINSIAINCDLDTIRDHLNDMKENKPTLYDRWTTFVNVDVASFKEISLYYDAQSANNRRPLSTSNQSNNRQNTSPANSNSTDHFYTYFSFTSETVLPTLNVDVLPKVRRSKNVH